MYKVKGYDGRRITDARRTRTRTAFKLWQMFVTSVVIMIPINNLKPEYYQPLVVAFIIITSYKHLSPILAVRLYSLGLLHSNLS